jgi:hypothetical protein
MNIAISQDNAVLIESCSVAGLAGTVFFARQDVENQQAQ